MNCPQGRGIFNFGAGFVFSIEIIEACIWHSFRDNILWYSFITKLFLIIYLQGVIKLIINITLITN